MQILKRMLSSLIFIVISVWVLLALLLYIFQPRFIYFPSKSLDFHPGNIGLDYQDVHLAINDKHQVHGWLIEHENPRATLLFFHGNAGNISHRLESIRIFNELGLTVFIIDYRGYGKSDGIPSESGTYEDALAAWEYLVNNQGNSPDEIIIFGRSLGGAVATWLASNRQSGGVILESTFTSISDIAKHYYPYLPVRYLARIKYPSISLVDKVSAPLLVIHSVEDELIPYKYGEQLFNRAIEPKKLLNIRGGHNDGFIMSGADYRQGISEFIDKNVPLDRT